jgi:hypothetical protein
MLHDAQRTSAPSALSVSIRTAVWMVMWSEPVMRAPFRGWREAYSSRMAIRPGISVSAIAISRAAPGGQRDVGDVIVLDGGGLLRRSGTRSKSPKR